MLDSGVLSDLGEELDDPATVKAFVSDYVEFWDERLFRMTSSLAAEDLGASLEAVVNLKAASTMVGAPRLTTLAGEVEAFLRRSEVREAVDTLPVLELCGHETVAELRTTYLQAPNCR